MSVQLTTFKDPQVTTLAVVSVNPVPNSVKKTLSFPGGTVVSIQPDGTVKEQTAGAAGPYEQADIDGQVATYWYTWLDNGVPKVAGPYTFAFVQVSAKS